MREFSADAPGATALSGQTTPAPTSMTVTHHAVPTGRGPTTPQHRRPLATAARIRRASFPALRPPTTEPRREAGACVLATPTSRPAAPGSINPRPPGTQEVSAMLTLTGNGRLTRDVHLRTTHSGKTVATISVASDRRDRDAPAVYVDLIVWEAQAHAAATHLIKGQAVSFSGRFEPRDYVTATGDQRIALELPGVGLEYGAKPHAADNVAAREPSATDDA